MNLKSLRWRLILVIVLSLGGLWLLLAPWLLYSVRSEVEKSLDDRLAASAQMVASLVGRQQLSAQSVANGVDDDSEDEHPAQRDTTTVPGVVNPPFPASLACRVSTLRGEVLAVSEGAPDDILEGTAEGYSNQEVQGQKWRVYTTTVDGLRITTADRLSVRDSLMGAVVFAAAVPFLAALLATLGVIWLAISNAFRPLNELTHAVAQRDLQSSDILEWDGSPAEVEPLVAAINRLLKRAHEAMQRERRFTGDAAHELRTPLTAIKTQLQVAALTDGKTSKHSLAQAERAVEKLQTTLEQLLVLVRLEGDVSFDDVSHTSADEIGADAILDVTSKAEQKGVQIQFQVECIDDIAAPAALAVTALRNLLENAIRFSPPGRQVILRSEVAGDQCVWTVHDLGPGVPEDQLQQLTRRFSRLQAGGTGLGLSIVDSIARRFAGRLELQNAATGGFIARLHLPLAIENP